MERKIGEIFLYNGEWLQCVKDTEDISCVNCYFYNRGLKFCTDEDIGDCVKEYRSDAKSICFKKLEKVEEPYMLEDKKFQKYKVFKTPYIYNKIDCSWQSFADPYYVSLEIKPNKEDMEEKKLNLKPFDIQKAREGKPVCTRDGRKARIICFDAKDTQPIIGLYEKNIDGIVREYLCSYHTDGRIYDDQDTGYDLMMLPEKKEGWVNVYKDSVYDTKDEALICRSGNGYIDTIKINWSE